MARNCVDRRPTLIVIVKEPQPGRVKTRLATDIGDVSAAWWFRQQTRRLIRNTSDPRWRTVISLAPDAAVSASRCWPPPMERWPQGSGDLGERMHRALARAMPGPALLIGGDIPAVDRAHIARAFRALRGADAVFGPATDGGFWAVGIRGPRVPSHLFKGARWSSEHALEDVLHGLKDHRVVLTDTLADVDTIADLAPGDIRATPLRDPRRAQGTPP